MKQGVEMKMLQNQPNSGLRVVGVWLVLISGLFLASCGYFESEQSKLEKARTLFNENKFNQSIIQSKKILQSDPKNCAARIILGQSQFAKFSLLDARETMNKAKQLGCKDDAVFEIALKSLMYQNKLAEAEKLIADPVFAQRSHLPQGLLLTGDVFFLRGDAANAEKFYTEHYTHTHDQAEHCLSRAKLLTLNRNYQGVIDKTAECEKLKPADNANVFIARVLYLKALAQLNAGFTDKCMLTLNAIIGSNSDPKDPNLKIQSALLLMKLNVSRKKIDTASKLADMLLHYFAVPDIYYVKGLQAEQDKRYDLAEQQFLAALKLNPNYRPSLLEMAKLKYKEGNIEQARYYTGRMDALSGKNSFTEHLDELLAVKYLKAGDLDSIINTLANDKKSQNLKSSYILALAYAKKGEQDKSWQVFHDIENKLDDPIRKDLLKARLHVAMGEYKQAEILFGKYTKIGNEYAIAGLAQLYISQKKYPEAESLLREALKDTKNTYNATLLLVEMYSLTNARQKALELLNTQVKTRKNKLAYQLLLAKANYKFGNYQNAVTVCKTVQKDNPDNIESYVVMANAYINLDNVEQAKSAYERVVKLKPGNVNAYLMLAYLADKSGDTNAAMGYVDQALASNPLNLKGIYAKVELLLTQHAEKRAIDFAQSKAKGLKSAQNGSLLMAFVYDKIGDAQKAYVNYRSALENGNRDIRTALRAYQASKSVNGADKAGKELGAFLSANPSEANIFFTANYFMSHADYASAEKYYLEYVKQARKNPVAFNNLAWLKLNKGDNRTALEFARQAHALAPDSPEIMDTLGQVLLGNDEVDSAGNYLKKAYAKLSDNPSVKYHLALYYYQKNTPEEAKKLLRDIVNRKFPEQPDAATLLKKITGQSN